MNRKRNQQGAVLVIALIMLVIVTLLAVTGVRTGILELRMSSNEEQRIIALQTAQGAIDQISERIENFRVIGVPDGDPINCTSNVTVTCQENSLVLAGAAVTNNEVKIVRIPPELGSPPRIRGAEFDVDKFRSVYFQIEAEHNRTDTGSGHAKLIQGQLVLIPSGS